ncbi:MAG: hypothetical protein Q7S01_03940 [bacterium]|nr:hypothetical protein [bacterium]
MSRSIEVGEINDGTYSGILPAGGGQAKYGSKVKKAVSLSETGDTQKV